MSTSPGRPCHNRTGSLPPGSRHRYYSAIMNSIPTDEELWRAIDEALADYPLLRKELPEDFPRAPKWEICSSKMDEYDQKRLKVVDAKFSQLINFPLSLWVSQRSEKEGARRFSKQALATFEKFLAKFSMLPGARSVLEPLWTDRWDLGDPKFWSIIAHCELALMRDASGARILGFGQQGARIGGGSRDADILYELNNEQFYFEIEMWHRAEIPSDALNPRSIIYHRAKEKVSKKFRDLPKGSKAILAIVCMSQPDEFEDFEGVRQTLGPFFLDDPPHCSVEVFWLVSTSNIDQIYGFKLVDSKAPALNLHPYR